jgi:2',3'-cyclic-nucleotide 2'-phosphodiesterase (5'-nucleotidase family)
MVTKRNRDPTLSRTLGRLARRWKLNSFGAVLLLLALLFGLGGTAFLLLQRKTVSRFDNRNIPPELVILQINDTYRIDAVRDGRVGGLGRVATLIRQTQQQNSHVMVVHAGDFISPSLESNFFQGQQMIDALNYLNGLAPLYVVPGNHEFDERGSSGGILANAIRKSAFDWVASNLSLTTSDTTANGKVLPYAIESVGALRLGIFAITIQVPRKIEGDEGPNYFEMSTSDRYEITDNTLAELRQEFHPAVAKALEGLKGQAFTQSAFISELKKRISKTDVAFWKDVNSSNKSFWATLTDDLFDSLSDQRKTELLNSLNGNEVFWSSIADVASQRYVQQAEATISKLETEGANVIIGLTHLDMADDKQIAALRQRHPSFMWIAGGHEHYAQHVGLSEDSALITKADSNARSVWKIEIGLRQGVPQISEEKIDIGESNLVVDPTYQQIIANLYHAKLKERLPYLDEPIIPTSTLIKASTSATERRTTAAGEGENKEPDECLHATEETVRNESSDWGTYLARQMMNAYSNPKARIAVLNGGGIRIDDNLCGTITYEEFERSIGFPTTVLYVELKGKTIRDLLETAVGRKRGDGSFLQTAGLRFEFSRQKVPGYRVQNVKVEAENRPGEWEDLDLEKAYWVAVSEYLFGGGDKYDFKTEGLCYVPTGPDLRTLVIQSLLKAKGNPSKVPTDKLLDGPFETPLYAKPWLAATGRTQSLGANTCAQ